MSNEVKKRILDSSDMGIREDEGVGVAEIVNSIKWALLVTQGELETSGIKLKRIELNLKSIASRKAGAGIRFQIPILGKLKIGSNVSYKSVQTISLVLNTPKTPTKDIIPSIGLDKNLKSLIMSLADGVKAAVDGNIPLEMGESWVELNFVLKSENEVSLIIETGFDAELTNSLKLFFEKI
ncbi:MAG: hypothetical protein HVN35_03670 [Methanobacteriaceae archaeon]|nr:hypothetical protein [Methanobacteriaceae archaeon]